MSEVLRLRASLQEMSKHNRTVSNQKQVDALSAQDYLNISHEVTRLFTEAADASPPTDATLRLLTTRLGWDVGGFWIVNELRMALECAAFYSHTPESFKNFETVSRARRSSFGEGLPGSAWKLRSVVCFPDLSKRIFPGCPSRPLSIYTREWHSRCTLARRSWVSSSFSAWNRVCLPQLPRTFCLLWEDKWEFFWSGSRPARAWRPRMLNFYWSQKRLRWPYSPSTNKAPSFLPTHS